MVRQNQASISLQYVYIWIKGCYCLKAIKEAREDIRINGAVSWDEIQNEIKNENKKDVA
ncbi:MAG: hypothetical protein KME60_07325 [Cyanomargarita calcarea GSE-NOS-MK-12-04C]|jgi:hypothetical protein|uniref:Uncharacterized protein n=1 Tax=Cyanomargarita calcarea GSE-NOS-MK-12-04C TaxID=2839659 RepID=A0A951UTZ1_9CYAN|nr:hypothetical protein [Cyanomargarita calcarea GSE-NOS-MK-12-04C]